MHLMVEHEGRRHAVGVVQTPDGHFTVTIDGVATAIDVRRGADGLLGIRLPDGSTHAVSVERSDALDERVVSVDGMRVVTALNGRRAKRSDSQTVSGQQRVMATMPGKVVRVLTAIGDQVQAKQPLVVVEAMKMENELSVARGGRVVDVLVQEGQSVEAGRLLVVVE